MWPLSSIVRESIRAVATLDVHSPKFPESESRVVVVRWLKALGEIVEQNEVIAELELSKVLVGVEAPCCGRLQEIFAPAGSLVVRGQRVATIMIDPGMQERYDARRLAEELERRKYCCTSMQSAIMGLGFGFKLERVLVQDSATWVLSTKSDGYITDISFCPWCGKPLPPATFE